MPSSAIFKLRKGVRVLNINDDTNYRVAAGFSPPPLAVTPVLAKNSNGDFVSPMLIDEMPNERSVSIPIRIMGDSEAEVTANANTLSYMLGLYGDPNEPLYLEYAPNSDVGFLPLWGQGPNRFYEIIHATRPNLGSRQGPPALRSKALPDASISLTLGPAADGRQQLVTSAVGGVLEDSFGAADGLSRGVLIPGATTNLITNPFFNHATWNTNWTETASLDEIKNTDPEYLLTGQLACALLVSRGATQNYTISATLAASAHVIWAIVKLPDGGTPSSSDVQIRYNGTDQTTTFTEMGNGFWFIEASVTGTGGAAATGITVQNGRAIYLQFMQAEVGFRSPMCHGDMLGCAWTTTAHASTSTRTAARLRLPTNITNFSTAEGTIRIAFRYNGAYYTGAHTYFFKLDSTTFRFYFNALNQSFDFSDGTNTIQYSHAWAVGETYIFHLVYEPGSLKMYSAGVQVATGSTYTPPVYPAYLYIGCTDAAGNQQTNTTLMDLATFGRGATAAEALADATNLAQMLSSKKCIGHIPWWWTSGGDNILDNANDSSYDNWGAAGGIPGSLPARTVFDLDAATLNSLWLSLVDQDFFVNPSYFYGEQSGTVDANCSGGEFDRNSVSTSFSGWEISLGTIAVDMLAGRQYQIFARIQDAGSNLTIANLNNIHSTDLILTDYVPVTLTAGAFRTAHTPPLIFQNRRDTRLSKDYTLAAAIIGFAAKRTSGTANLDCDFLVCMPSPLARIYNTAGFDGVIIDGDTFQVYVVSSGLIWTAARQIEGDVIEFRPEKVNVLVAIQGNESNANSITDTLEFRSIKITPRYALL